MLKKSDLIKRVEKLEADVTELRRRLGNLPTFEYGNISVEKLAAMLARQAAQQSGKSA